MIAKLYGICAGIIIDTGRTAQYGGAKRLCQFEAWASFWVCKSKEQNGHNHGANEFEARVSFRDYKRAVEIYKSGQLTKALQVLDQMDRRESSWAMSVAFVQLLQHCSKIQALKDGRKIHAHVKKCGLELDIFVANTLLSMYSKCKSLVEACHVFQALPQKDVVSFNAMIAGYAKEGHGYQALGLYQEMKLQGLIPNRITYVCLLNACTSLRAIEQGKQVHADIIQAKLEADLVVGSALMDMYVKLGYLLCACNVFQKMSQKNVIAWTTLIGGHVKHGRSKQALKLFHKMKRDGVKPNDVTYICVLNACASLADIAKGKQLHSEISKSGVELDVKLGNALIDMYAKCGSLWNAEQVFHKMLDPDVISWSTMMAGHLTLGSKDQALSLFREMQKTNVKPDDVTFINLLSLCSHMGFLEEGLELFESMTRVYGLTPRLEHYGCLVDLFGRAGQLEKGYEFIRTMPIPPDASVWMALLGTCTAHGNIELAECISKQILKVDPQNEAVYIVLSNVYAAAGNWDAKMGVRKLMEARGLSKEPGRCWI